LFSIVLITLFSGKIWKLHLYCHLCSSLQHCTQVLLLLCVHCCHLFRIRWLL
jgi:hypothetical protein